MHISIRVKHEIDSFISFENFEINFVLFYLLRSFYERKKKICMNLGCGISLAKQTAQRRIVGGDDAGFGSFPWQAYIRIGSSR